ncbi:MAG: site-specific DNA-methyltransferase [Planctomycetes bacterium]|nr:site-specific DNA-methyltransferase [Planctomycetota bacterium]
MIPTNEIIQGDVLEFLRELPAECADLVIADPPYNLNKDFGIGVRHSDVETWLHWSAQWLAELKRILSPSGNLFVYSIHHFACFLQCRLYEMDLIYRRQIIWHYENGWSMYKNGPACHYEPLLWFAKRADSTFHVIREPYKSQARLKHKITKNGKVWQPHPDGRQAGDVWRFPTLAGRRFADERTPHPTQKPLDLCRRLVRYFSNEGDLVLVPFVGSGSECVAAAELHRNFTGVELNPEYVAIANQRLASIKVGEVVGG